MRVEADIHSRSIAAGYQPELLFDAKVAVVGAGALGQNVLQCLALSGIGEFLLVDFDEFEAHNSTRSPFFPARAEAKKWGLAKAKVVAHKLLPLMTAFHPRMRYVVAPVQQVGDLVVDWADVVVSAVDSGGARAYLAERCRIHAKTMVEAGFHGPDLNLSVFGPDPAEPCYRCINPDRGGSYSCRAYALEAEAAGIIPAIQDGAAVLGGLQAEQVIGWLHGEATLRGRRAYLNIRTLAASVGTLMVDNGCPGIHRALEMRDLDLSPSAPLKELLRAVDLLAGAADVVLPEPFAGRIACPGCGTIAEPLAPEWRWQLSPRCTDCGGPFPPVPGSVPMALSVLRTDNHDDTDGLSCEQVGLGPGAVAIVQADAGSECLIRVPGTLDLLDGQLGRP